MTGKIVISKAGHDKGQLFVVSGVSEENDGCVFIADGKRRRIEDPKKKKLKHLGDTGKRMDTGEGFTDRSIRRTLNMLKADLI